MISYAPLWQTMKRQGASTYTLQVKGGISSSTIRRLKAGDSVSTNTLDALCKSYSAPFLTFWSMWKMKNSPCIVVDKAGARLSLFFVYTGANFALLLVDLFFPAPPL